VDRGGVLDTVTQWWNRITRRKGLPVDAVAHNVEGATEKDLVLINSTDSKREAAHQVGIMLAGSSSNSEVSSKIPLMKPVPWVFLPRRQVGAKILSKPVVQLHLPVNWLPCWSHQSQRNW